jgi:PAS domain S-box-containing protein
MNSVGDGFAARVADVQGLLPACCNGKGDIPKPATAALSDREELFRTAFHNAPFGMILCAVDTRIVQVNARMCQMVGYTEQELLASTWMQLTHKDDIGISQRAVDEMLRGRLPTADIEKRYIHKNGNVIEVRLRVSLVLDARSNPAYFITHVEDVTDRNRMVAELREERHILYTLMDNLPDMIYFKDRESRFTRINPALAKLFGLSDPAQAVGNSDFDYFAAQHAQLAHDDEQEIIRTGQPKVGKEEKETWPDGNVRWASTTKMPLRDAAGNIIGTFGVSRDITERKLAEAENTRLAAIVNSSDDAIFSTSREGNIATWNAGAERMFGYKAEEVKGRHFSLLIPEDRRPDLAANKAVLMRGEAPMHYEHENQRKDGTRLQVALTLSPIKDPSGAVTGVSVITRDITERKRAEEELQRAKEAAEAASRAKSEFVANMSHEIRTPMNGIIGMTDLALDTPLNAEQREYLTMVKDSGNDLLTLINDVLDFSKIEAGKLSLDPTEFNLRELMANTLKPLAVRASMKGPEIVLGVKPGVPEHLIGDGGRLRQVIVNLVENAIKFTRRGEIAVGVDIESRQGENLLLHFSIRDTGIGIPAEKQKVIFDAFTQADSSMTREYGGTGLGLTISSRLVQMMGGKIWVQSVVGEGSTFHFTARLGQTKAPVTESVSRNSYRLRDLDVLVVDDNTTNRKILDAMLKHWLMRPEMASSGEEGLAVLERAASAGRPFPLVLLDAQMPEMDGFALAERIKQNPQLAGATIMMLASAGERGDAARCRELGIAVYLIKPIRRSELLEALLAALGKSAGKERATVITRHTLHEDRRKLRILLAEDNAVNQQLGVRLLEKRGHTVTVAANGNEALALLEESRFDLVLMDVQMPKMNGLQVTSAIRREEQSTAKHLPIIAMTAHAMQGDRERCLAAGMDGYLAKPINAEELDEAVENLDGRPGAAPAAITANPEPLDIASALERLEGDAELLQEAGNLFLEQLPDLRMTLRAAINAGDAKAIECAAHRLRGSVASFSAQPASEAAWKLETLGRDGILSETERAHAELEKEIDRLKSAMADLVGSVALPSAR